MNKRKKSNIFTCILLSAFLVMFTLTPLIAGVDESDTSDELYSENADNSNDASKEKISDKPKKVETKLPSLSEIFGENADKVECDRSQLMYTWHLTNVKPDDVSDTIKSLFEKQMSDEKIGIIVNSSGNSIIAKFPDRKNVNIRKEWADAMASLDGTPKQALIEVMIVELVLNNIDQSGIDFRTLGNGVLGGKEIFQSLDVTHTADSMEVEAKSAEGLKYFATDGDKLKALLFSGRTNNKTKVLSCPQIIASDNKPAVFKLGRTLPIITGTTIANGVTTYAYENKDIGININLTPHFGAKGKINLDINQEMNDLLSYDPDKKIADFATKTLTSNVTLRSGETVALGGYIQNSKRLNRKNVPALAKLPFIGKYLKRDTETNDRVEVVVFITPKIISDTRDIKVSNYTDKDQFKAKKKLANKIDRYFDNHGVGKRTYNRQKRKNAKKARKRSKTQNISAKDKLLMNSTAVEESNEAVSKKKSDKRTNPISNLIAKIKKKMN